jgi:hypothetical protein
MKDANEVSLESDRLEQLLEAPGPAQPVVMVQYRNRGVPWWVLVPLLFLAPLVAILIYHQQVVERYRAQAAEATHVMEATAEAIKARDRVIATPTPSSPGVTQPTAVTAAGAQPRVVAAANEPATPRPAEVAGGAAVSAPGPGAAPVSRIDEVNGPAGPGTPPVPTRSTPAAGPVASAGPGAGSSPAAGKPVRSINPSPFELEGDPAASNGAAGAPTGRGSGAPVALAPDETHKRDSVPAEEPLPSREELDQQIAEEAARKERDMAEERAVRVAGIRALRYEDRVKFHKELGEILETYGKLAGPEIDKLAKRSAHDYDMAVYSKAQSIWRHGKMTPQAKVSAIRSLDIPEPAILNFISDNLYARLRAPGGPRDNNELRLRAAQLLLSYELPAAPPSSTEPGPAPGDIRAPAKTSRPRQTGGRLPQ